MLWRFYINITGCVGITVYWSETILIIFLKENVFIKLFEKSFGSNILHHLPNFNVEVLILLVLLEFKLFKFTFKTIIYVNNAWILL